MKTLIKPLSAYTLNECIAAFISHSRSKNLSVRTLEYYADRLQQFAKFLSSFYPDVMPEHITSSMVREYVTWTLESTSAATANHSLAVLKRFLQFLKNEGFISSNPAAGLQKLKEEKRVIETFSQDQIGALLSTCGRDFYGVRDRAIILTLLDCGLRAEELCTLKLNDVDWTNRTFRVFGKGRKERVVPFGQVTLQALTAYMARREEIEEEALFVNHYGEALDRYRLRDIIVRRGKMAGITGVRCSPHTLRHTCAVFYLRAGGDTFSLQKLLGHTSQAMTKRYCESLTAEDIQNKHRLYSPADRLKNVEANGGRRKRLR